MSPVWRILAPLIAGFVTFTVTLILATIAMFVFSGPHSNQAVPEAAVPLLLGLAFLIPTLLGFAAWYLVRRKVQRIP